MREGLREGVHEQLEHVGVQIGELQEEPLACRRLHGAKDIEPLEDMLDRPHRLHAASREAPAADGQQPKAAFILAEHPDGADVRRWDDLLELGLTGGLERRNGLGIFLCDWAEPL